MHSGQILARLLEFAVLGIPNRLEFIIFKNFDFWDVGDFFVEQKSFFFFPENSVRLRNFESSLRWIKLHLGPRCCLEIFFATPMMVDLDFAQIREEIS